MNKKIIVSVDYLITFTQHIPIHHKNDYIQYYSELSEFSLYF